MRTRAGAPTPPVRLLLVFPGPSLVRKAVRAGLEVRVVAGAEAGEFALPDAAVAEHGTAEVIRELIDRHDITHVLDGGGFPLRDPLSGQLSGQDDPFRRRLVPGEETGEADVVVSTLTVDGMHRVVAITGREASGACVYPASLSEADTVRARAVVTSTLDLVGHEFGPAQTGVALGAPDPRVRWSRPCFDVGGIAGLIELATGFDLATELFRALAGAVLSPPVPRWFAASRGGAVVEGVSAEAVRARLAELPEPVTADGVR